MWLLRLSLALGRLPSELADLLTVEDLARYQALAEIDGPWWGSEHVAAHLRQLGSVQAAAVGADVPPDRFKIRWSLGGGGEDVPELLPPRDGLELFAGRHGLPVTEVRDGSDVDRASGPHPDDQR